MVLGATVQRTLQDLFSVASSLPHPMPCGPGLGPRHKAALWVREGADCMALRLLLTGEVRPLLLGWSRCPDPSVAYKSLPGLPSSGRGLCALTHVEWGRRRRASCLGGQAALASQLLREGRLRHSCAAGTHLGQVRACYGVLCSPATEPSVLFELYFFSLIKVCVHYGKEIQKEEREKDSTPKQALLIFYNFLSVLF